MSEFRNLIIDKTKQGGQDKYIQFADPEFERVLLSENIGDGVGITEQDALQLTTLPSFFRNEELKSLADLKHFPNINVIPANCFYECGNLEDVNLTYINTIKSNAFRNCTKLRCELPLDIIIEPTCLVGVTITNTYITPIGMNTLTTSQYQQIIFENGIIVREGVTSISNFVFYNIRTPFIFLPASVLSMSSQFSLWISNYATVKIYTYATTPPETVSFQGHPTIYVPKGSIDAYRNSNSWKNGTFIEFDPEKYPYPTSTNIESFPESD